jgi:hypothetical protein
MPVKKNKDKNKPKPTKRNGFFSVNKRTCHCPCVKGNGSAYQTFIKIPINFFLTFFFVQVQRKRSP